MTKTKVKYFLMGAAAALLLLAWPAMAASNGPAGTKARAASAIAENPRLHSSILSFGGGSPLVVPAAAFASDGFDPDSLFFSFGGGYMTGNAQNYGCVDAPVYLPQSAIVKNMFVSLYDNDASRGMTATFWRVDNFTGSVNQLGSVSTTAGGADAAIQVLNDNTITFPDIRYPDYSYYVTSCLGSSSLRLYSVRFQYAFSEAFLPAVSKDALP